MKEIGSIPVYDSLGEEAFPGGGGACWSVVYRCVTKKTIRKGTFYELGSAQRCHHLGLEKCFFVGKGYVFTSFAKGCRS